MMNNSAATISAKADVKVLMIAQRFPVLMHHPDISADVEHWQLKSEDIASLSITVTLKNGAIKTYPVGDCNGAKLDLYKTRTRIDALKAGAKSTMTAVASGASDAWKSLVKACS